MEQGAEHFNLEYEFTTHGAIGLKKYQSNNSQMKVYFADVDSQVINGYFCFGSEQPDIASVETLLYHLDSSGGLLPRPMRGEMLRPAWQFHGAENPLADRDQSCFVCCALGETAFMGTFSCSTYLLQSIDAVFQVHGHFSPYQKEKEKGKTTEKPMDAAAGDKPAAEGKQDSDSDEEEQEPDVYAHENYCLSEAGEGAMAWETTLQSIFPGKKSFWNRLLNDGRSNSLNKKLRKIYDTIYRPENMTVIITGTVKSPDHVLGVLHEYEMEYLSSRPNLPKYVPPWSTPLPPSSTPGIIDVRFFPRNPIKAPTATICVGFRGCPSKDLETAMALKVLTAHLAVSPLWTRIVTTGHAHRISWCQLEYSETCSLFTIHGIKDDEGADTVTNIIKDTITSSVKEGGDGTLKVDEIRAMIDRVKWHYIRELESEPYLILAAAVSKADRYGDGAKDQLEKRIHPGLVYDTLKSKPIEYWIRILKAYAVDQGLFITRVLPKHYDVKLDLETPIDMSKQAEISGEMNFATSSKRAASRPRRKANNAMAEESNVAVDDDGRNANIVLPDKDKPEAAAACGEENKEKLKGHLEEFLKAKPFPVGEHDTDCKEFEERLEVTKDFLDHVASGNLRSWSITTYTSDGREQHPLFSLSEMPFYTFLEDTKTDFVYLTMVLDTTCLDAKLRKMLAPLTAALGAVVCPRPPGLDTDAEIENKNEFNPPLYLADSQVSIGLNGEMMQSIFLTLIVRPEKYRWAVGLLNFIMHENSYNASFLKFITKEAIRGLAANYRMQTPDEPNYECFEASEINLHGLINQIYKEESNARLFVGRRRLDIMLEYLADLENNTDAIVQSTNEAWKKMIQSKKYVLQVACDIGECAKVCDGGMAKPWKEYFPNTKAPKNFEEVRPKLEREVMNEMAPGKGVIFGVKNARPPCLTTAIPINPNTADFPKLCVAAQLFSMAQKWIWSCWDEEDMSNPVLRMPCSYANLITLNIESNDVIGFWKVMKEIVNENWIWLKSLLVATKLMVLNDPAALELGPQGTIVSALLSHLNGQDLSVRRDLLKESMKVTVEDIKYICNEYLADLFNPQKCWSVVMADGEDKEELQDRLEEEFGFKFENLSLEAVCLNL